MRLVGETLLLFLVYFITARLGLTLDAVGGFASLVWPAAGIAIASLYLGGYKLWPAIFFAALLVNFLNGASPVAALSVGIGNTLEAFLGAFILRKILAFNPSIERLKDALSLINVCVLCPVISATIGVSGLYLSGIVSWEMFEPVWLAWWVGDLLGILIVAPFIFVWSKSRRTSLTKTGKEHLFEVILLFGILITICFMAFKGFLGIDAREVPITQTLYPLLIWFGIRFNPRLSFTAIFIVAIIAVWGTVEGTGPFIRGRLSENLFYLQAFLGTIALTFIILTAVMAERKRLQSLKDEFISAASHELRTPITTLKAYAELIGRGFKKNSKDVLPKGGTGLSLYISRMEDQVNRLINLVNELLDISRIQSGKVKLDIDELNMGDLLKEISQDYKRTVTTHKIIYEGLPKGKSGKSPDALKVYADRFRVSQVLTNLIANAIKFSPKADKVIIAARKENNKVVVSVKDFGKGIDPKYHREVFSRFFQAEQNLKSDSAGLGLGLYISSEIIKQHKGEIWVDSKPGKGSTFSFKLPAKE